MDSSYIDEIIDDIESALDDLDFSIEYSVDYHYDRDYEGKGYHIFESSLDIYSVDEDAPENWDELVEDAISDVADDWGGKYGWDDWTIWISIGDDDEDDDDEDDDGEYDDGEYDDGEYDDDEY